MNFHIRVWTGDEFVYPSVYSIDWLNDNVHLTRGGEPEMYDLAQVSSSTGLKDKDDRDIYLGDIVRLGSRKYTVAWGTDGWLLYHPKENPSHLGVYAERCRVIGNTWKK